MNVAMDYILNTPEENDAAHITSPATQPSGSSSMVSGMVSSTQS